ncbi:MAG: hypothetical protein JKY56_10295 [Kofleriaceae bacterium]|nr:hypothetical protein [Kofleriaceae bacterium]
MKTWLLASLTLSLLACSGTAAPVVHTPADKSDKTTVGQSPEQSDITPADTSDNTGTIEAIADALLLHAKQDEPLVTPMLQELAKAANGELVGLQHRLKKRSSMIRKIRVKSKNRPLADVAISDALRYTMRIEDDPDGLHVRTIIDVVATLESKGHQVVKLKNYWPKGDNYSGVNSVLRSPSGLLWELQFHTSDSLRIQKATRDSYEELRQATTPISRKRELFDQMSAFWEDVEIPDNALKPHLMHPTEQIILHPRP